MMDGFRDLPESLCRNLALKKAGGMQLYKISPPQAGGIA